MADSRQLYPRADDKWSSRIAPCNGPTVGTVDGRGHESRSDAPNTLNNVMDARCDRLVASASRGGGIR